jgi:hypothetical protein
MKPRATFHTEPSEEQRYFRIKRGKEICHEITEIQRDVSSCPSYRPHDGIPKSTPLERGREDNHFDGDFIRRQGLMDPNRRVKG